MITCLRDGHDATLVAAAALICALGALVSTRMFNKVSGRVVAGRKAWHVLQAGLTGGATIWTTHFVAMIGFDPGVPVAYHPLLTMLSLVLAIAGVAGGLWMIARSRGTLLAEAGGAVIGLAVLGAHYIGMAGLRLSADLVWHPGMVIASVVLALGFGALTANRIARPRTRFCWYGGVVAFSLAIASGHFTAMGALTVAPHTVEVPLDGLVPDRTLAMLVLLVMGLFLLVGFSGFLIGEDARRDAAERLRRQSLHDPLTGLPNRTMLRNRLSQLLDSAGCDEVIVAVGIDLDRFKPINDVHGHAGGDALLRALSDRMTGLLGPQEMVCRSGGDEFIALKADAKGPEDAIAFARRLHDALTRPVDWQGFRLSVGASLGVALAPQHGGEVETLLGRVDLAMYRAKASSEQVVIYDPAMDEASRARSLMAVELRAALELDQLEVHFQAQNDIPTRDLVGFEALARWRHPERGMIPPSDFIPIAEATGLIRELGVWVLNAACREAVSWAEPLRVAVNVAPQQLAQPDFAETVLDALLVTGLEPSRLELEVTEASLISDKRRAEEVMASVKAAGVRIAMDDYGTGYASLSTLQTFPFDKIKIDQSFIKPLGRDRQAAAIVRSTLILGEALGIPVLAEGVETETQLAFLDRARCREAQGYLFGKPCGAAETAERVREQWARKRAEFARGMSDAAAPGTAAAAAAAGR